MSLWLDQLPHRAREGVNDELDVDIAIVGAGFTGLWTAYFLSEQNPAAKIVIIERERVGFGASGRNGGWASSLYPISYDRLVLENGVEKADLVRSIWRESIDLLEQFLKANRIDCGFHKGGSLAVARSQVQWKRLRKQFQDDQKAGEGVHLLSAHEVAERININKATGGLFTEECARINPAQLVFGLADLVEKRNIKIFESSEVISLRPGRSSISAHGVLKVKHRSIIRRVQAKIIIEATEGYLPLLNSPARSNRSVVPVYSLMVATAPLSTEIWDRIGWQGRETLNEATHLINYAQRTADDRIAIGGRGAPYMFNSAIKPDFEQNPNIHQQLRSLARTWFPELSNVEFTHAWGGPLAIARDWHPTVSFDGNYARAGGYVGDGVVSSFVAGQSLADLISGKSSRYTELPWIAHKSPLWEGEPLRWLAVNAGLQTMKFADREESITQHESKFAKFMAPFLGH